MPDRAAPDPRSADDNLGALVVLVGILLANVGVWRAGIPFGDEASRINDGFSVLRGEHSTNLYSLLCAALLRTVAPDPMDVHLIMRVIASVGSTLGLYYLLRAFRRLPSTPVAVACLVWGCSKLCTPPTQNADYNVFAFALFLPALGYLLRRTTLFSLLTFALASYWTVQIRPEYLAPMILISVAGAVYLWRERRASSPEEGPSRGAERWKTIAVAVALVASVPLASAFRAPSEINSDDYLLLGLGQCYAIYYSERHPEEHFTPLTEYEPLLNRVFGNPHSFKEAVANNPRELARYLAGNGLHNLSKTPRPLVWSRNRSYNAVVLGIIAFGGAIGLGTLWRRRRGGQPLSALIAADDLWRIFLLVLFTSAASCSIFLLIPEPRYWISFIPLFYLLLAWSLHNLLGRFLTARQDTMVRVLAIVAFGFPVFVGVRSDRGLMDVIRRAVSGTDHPPSVAGNWVLPFSTFAFGDRGVAWGQGYGLTIDQLRSRRADIIVLDGLLETRFAVTNQAFFQQLLSAPESVGYRPLPEAARYGWTLYARLPDRR